MVGGKTLIVLFVHMVDKSSGVRHTMGVRTRIMKGIQLAPRLRYVPLSDDKGDFGVIVVHDGDKVNYTIEVSTREELRAAIQSFQERPVGYLVK